MQTCGLHSSFAKFMAWSDAVRHHVMQWSCAPTQLPGLTLPRQLITIQSNPIPLCSALIRSDAIVMQSCVSLGEAHDKKSANIPTRSNPIHPKDVLRYWNDWDAKVFNPVRVKRWNSFASSMIWLLQQAVWLSNSIGIDLYALQQTSAATTETITGKLPSLKSNTQQSPIHSTINRVPGCLSHVKHQPQHLNYVLVLPACQPQPQQNGLFVVLVVEACEFSAGCYAVAFCQGCVVGCILFPQVSLQCLLQFHTSI